LSDCGRSPIRHLTKNLRRGHNPRHAFAYAIVLAGGKTIKVYNEGGKLLGTVGLDMSSGEQVA
jgi:hypothetical protein